MNIFLTTISLLLASLQAVIAYFWTHGSGGVAVDFTSTLQSLYGYVPVWSDIAFSMGAWWYCVAVIIAVVSVAANFFRVSRLALAGMSFVSLVAAVAMIYAMYPIHLMATGDII